MSYSHCSFTYISICSRQWRRATSLIRRATSLINSTNSAQTWYVLKQYIGKSYLFQTKIHIHTCPSDVCLPLHIYILFNLQLPLKLKARRGLRPHQCAPLCTLPRKVSALFGCIFGMLLAFVLMHVFCHLG